MLNLDWNEAPIWAEYYSIDKDGTKVWYEDIPFCITGFIDGVRQDLWFPKGNYSRQKVHLASWGHYPEWKKSLERRPKL